MGIKIGLGGWGDHDSLYRTGTRSGDKLASYTRHFPIVEIDSTFYAIQSAERMKKWIAATPARFRFIVKAYQGMTGHQRGQQATLTGEKREEMYASFISMLEPMIEENRLTAVLFQYPPWFDCLPKHVMALRAAKKRMGSIPCALEFRNQTWFADGMKERTLTFMRDEGWIHTVCDEPQAGMGSVPTIAEATHPELTMIRLHGRNVTGWNDTGDERWREVRYLYEYNEQELIEWLGLIEQLQLESEEIVIIFNNNSGGHAAGNAKQLMTMLKQQRPDGKAPLEPVQQSAEQLELF